MSSGGRAKKYNCINFITSHLSPTLDRGIHTFRSSAVGSVYFLVSRIPEITAGRMPMLIAENKSFGAVQHVRDNIRVYRTIILEFARY